MKRIVTDEISAERGTLYPPPYDEPCLGREKRRLGSAADLNQFGVNYTRLPPGVWSSQRHWHSECDEFVFVLAGEVSLITDSGREALVAGDCAGFPGGNADGHHFVNESADEVILLEIGTRSPADVAYYSEIDLIAPASGDPSNYTRLDGSPYPNLPRRGIK